MPTSDTASVVSTASPDLTDADDRASLALAGVTGLRDETPEV